MFHTKFQFYSNLDVKVTPKFKSNLEINKTEKCTTGKLLGWVGKILNLILNLSNQS